MPEEQTGNQGKANRRKKEKTQYPGVRYREHETRKHKGNPDRYFTIRYKIDGKLKEEGVGWTHEGMNAQTANRMRSELMHNIRTGQGPKTLQEKRDLEEAERQEAQYRQDQEERDRKTFGQAWESYLEWAKVNKKSWPADQSRYNKHLVQFADVALKDITPFDVEELKTAKTKADLSASSVHQIMDLKRC